MIQMTKNINLMQKDYSFMKLFMKQIIDSYMLSSILTNINNFETILLDL